MKIVVFVFLALSWNAISALAAEPCNLPTHIDSQTTGSVFSGNRNTWKNDVPDGACDRVGAPISVSRCSQIADKKGYSCFQMTTNNDYGIGKFPVCYACIQ